jgi:hypothetical protein
MVGRGQGGVPFLIPGWGKILYTIYTKTTIWKNFIYGLIAYVKGWSRAYIPSLLLLGNL